MRSKTTVTGEQGVYDGANRVFSDSSGPMVQTRAVADSEARWRTNLTGTLATTVMDIARHYVNGTLTGWLNEWGALRGTAPYTWGDALVRAIHTSTDGIVSGTALEIQDRTGQTNIVRWGRKWIDGALVRNGYSVRETYVWKTGDADPTSAGTVALPANAQWIFVLATADALPTWAPTGSITIRS